MITPSLSPEATTPPSGLQATHKTQFLWPTQIPVGVSVLMSQNLKVWSPEQETKSFPSGLNCTSKMESLWPSREEEILVTGRTLKRLWG